MLDIVYFLLAVAFFGLTAALVAALDKLKE